MFFKKKAAKPVGCRISSNTANNTPIIKETEKKEPKEAKRSKKEIVKEEIPIEENKELEK